MSATELEQEQLCTLLAALIDILDEEGDSHWASWMRSSRKMISAGDPSGIEHFLGAFGGMGSFNDLGSERSLAVAAKAYALAKSIQERTEGDSR
jgi:hypothetical protein